MARKYRTLFSEDWESIALPIVLMITGIVLLGGDLAGMLSLDRIQNLWPLALVTIGLAELVPAPEQQPAKG
ncbi:MAG: hypothetical protein JO211_08120 [Acidobacteriaceae bacterium]|nr:hypothetical protein [Acidobacteriaceae bacterium]